MCVCVHHCADDSAGVLNGPDAADDDDDDDDDSVRGVALTGSPHLRGSRTADGWMKDDAGSTYDADDADGGEVRCGAACDGAVDGAGDDKEADDGGNEDDAGSGSGGRDDDDDSVEMSAAAAAVANMSSSSSSLIARLSHFLVSTAALRPACFDGTRLTVGAACPSHAGWMSDEGTGCGASKSARIRPKFGCCSSDAGAASAASPFKLFPAATFCSTASDPFSRKLTSPSVAAVKGFHMTGCRRPQRV